MSYIKKRLKNLSDPRETDKAGSYDFLIGFIDPRTGKDDETDAEVDFRLATAAGIRDTVDFKGEILKVWKDFCKDNGFDWARTILTPSHG